MIKRKEELVMKKKNLLVVLCILMAMSATLLLSACKDSDKDDKDSSKKTSVSDSVDSDKDDSDDDSDVSVKAYEKGTIKDQVWSSDYLGLTFTAPEGWAYFTDEQLKTLLGQGADNMNVDKSEIDAAVSKTVYEFMAMKTDNTASVGVCAEPVPVTIKSGDQYLKALKSTMTNMSKVKFTFSDADDITVGNINFKGLKAKAETGAVQAYYSFVKDDRAICVIITTQNEADIENLVSCLSAK